MALGNGHSAGGDGNRTDVDTWTLATPEDTNEDELWERILTSSEVVEGGAGLEPNCNNTPQDSNNESNNTLVDR